MQECKEMQPITQEMLSQLDPWDRQKALEKYHAWLDSVRKQDKRVETNRLNRIRTYLTKERKPPRKKLTEEEKKIRAKNYYDLNRKKILAQYKARYYKRKGTEPRKLLTKEEKKERQNLYAKNYYARNKDKIIAHNKAYQQRKKGEKDDNKGNSIRDSESKDKQG